MFCTSRGLQKHTSTSIYRTCLQRGMQHEEVAGIRTTSYSCSPPISSIHRILLRCAIGPKTGSAASKPEAPHYRVCPHAFLLSGSYRRSHPQALRKSKARPTLDIFATYIHLSSAFPSILAGSWFFHVRARKSEPRDLEV